MIQELQNIKEQLFDAPNEVKEAFDSIVNYFDKYINNPKVLELRKEYYKIDSQRKDSSKRHSNKIAKMKSQIDSLKVEIQKERDSWDLEDKKFRVELDKAWKLLEAAAKESK